MLFQETRRHSGLVFQFSKSSEILQSCNDTRWRPSLVGWRPLLWDFTSRKPNRAPFSSAADPLQSGQSNSFEFRLLPCALHRGTKSWTAFKEHLQNLAKPISWRILNLLQVRVGVRFWAAESSSPEFLPHALVQETKRRTLVASLLLVVRPGAPSSSCNGQACVSLGKEKDV